MTTEILFPCPRCDGVGEHVCERCRRADPTGRAALFKCPRCGGTRMFGPPEAVGGCHACGSTGRLTKPTWKAWCDHLYSFQSSPEIKASLKAQSEGRDLEALLAPPRINSPWRS